ncbi:hypothetical protein B0H19DRAFT_97186 [Mycena capillaripes]|nr:hypothetical protein B0H19DRAFT_97186 [Mycena capillaripes]
MSAFSSRCSECGSVSSSPRFREEKSDVSAAPETWHRALLNSNQPPEESELTFVQSAILQADASLARLDEEISELQGKLRQFEAERASLFTYRTGNSAIISPLRRMPPELLREIFSWTMPTINRTLGWNEICIGQSPWALTHICSRWRMIALSTPSLWSLVVMDYSETSSSYSLPLIEAQLQRSTRLKIHFYGNHEMDPGPQIQMFQLLLRHSSHWEELSIGLTSDLTPLVVALRDSVPSLRRLWIQWTCPEAQMEVQSIDCFQTAYSLVDVGMFNEFRCVPILLPGQQLTRYQLDCPWKQHMRILKQAANLIEARIYVNFDHEPISDSDADGTIDLMHLQHLYVSDAPVLKYLRLPALEELALGTQHPDLLSLVHSLLSRSACCLRRVCLISPRAKATIKLLQSFSSITELLIKNDDGCDGEANALMDALTVRDLPGSVLLSPHLRLMFFGCEDDSYIDYRAYLDMVKSRWTAEHCALTAAALLVEDGPKPSSATICDLNALRRDGLDFLSLEEVEASDEMRRWSFETSWI